MITVPVDPALHRVFDLIAWMSAAATGYWLARSAMAPAVAPIVRTKGYVIAAAAGAIIGAYLVGSSMSLFSSSGALSHSVAGALAGGILAIELFKLSRGERRSTGGSFVAPFVVGLVIGRWGCHFAGLADGTYGVPTELPWGVSLGDAVARHPVALYESAAMAVFLAVYLASLRSKAEWTLAHGFHVMAAYYGAQRFLWEFLKPYPKLIGPFNLFHVVSIGLVLYGVGSIILARRNRA
jgi:prolipoprotein diacylglyceryltransferase